MTLSNVQPTYPAGIFPWTDRVDQQNIVFAEDVNPLAAEIESIENTIGTTPNVEPNPPQGGSPVVFASISARISAAMNNSQLPVVSLGNSSFTCPNNTSGSLIPHFVHFDPFNCFNGTDITAPAGGWWIVTTAQQWNWWNDGYSHHMLCLNGFNNILHEEFVDWEFPGNIVPISQTFPQALPTPRWWQFGKRPVRTTVTWQGLLNKGDRLSVLAENGTSNPGHVINNIILKAVMIKSVSGSFVSG